MYKVILPVACLGLVLAALFLPSCAQVQRAQSPITSEVVGGESESSPPPEGMSGLLGKNIIVGGNVDTHLQGELTKPKGTNLHSTVYDDTDLELYGNYSNWFSLNSNIKLERNRNDNENSYYPDRNSAFRSEGLTMRQLYTTVRPVQGVVLYGGKIHPGFGAAYSDLPGNFYNFATDYEQDERIGLGAQYRLADGFGIPNGRITFETFYLDTSLLSTSLISQPALDDSTADRLRHYQRGAFGPSNTGGLDSQTVTFHGGYAERGLTYQLSFTHEATDDPAGRPEYGVSVNASYDPSGDGIPLTSRLGVTPFLEYTHFNNFGGIAALDRHYVLAGASFANTRWHYIVTGGLRKSEGAATDTDYQQNVSVNYRVTPELRLGGGINHTTIARQGSWTIGPSLSYEIGF